MQYKIIFKWYSDALVKVDTIQLLIYPLFIPIDLQFVATTRLPKK